MKDEIMRVLREFSELNLTAIQQKLQLKPTDKPKVLHHLRALLQKGLVRKTEKTYKIVDVDGLPAERIESIRIPLITAKAGASDVFLNENVSTGEINTSATFYNPEDLMMVRVSGDSMCPTFNAGDLLLFRKFDDRPKNNDIVLWRVDDGAKIKRFKWGQTEEGEPFGWLLSDNVQDAENRPIRIDDTNSEFISKFVSVIDRAKDIDTCAGLVK